MLKNASRPTKQHLIEWTEPLLGEMWAAQHRGAQEALPRLPGKGAESAPWALAVNPCQPGLGPNNSHQKVGAHSQMQAGRGEGEGSDRASSPASPTPPALTWLCSRKAKSHCSLVIKGWELFSVKRSTQCLKLPNRAGHLE